MAYRSGFGGCFPKKAVVALFFGLCSVSASHAQLIWAQKAISVTAKPEDATCKVTFDFENKGARPVTIQTVQTSCSCVSALSLGKKTYALGEAGQVTLSFSVGGRTGEQKKQAIVSTDDPSSNATLSLSVTIPQLYTLSPSVLYWKKGESLDPKTVNLSFEAAPTAKVKEVRSSDPSLAVVAERTPGQNEYRITVTPKISASADSALFLKSLITIETDLPSPGRSNILLYALVKR